MTPHVRIHYHRPGKGTTVYHEHLVLDRPSVKVTLLAEYDGDDVAKYGQIILGAGAPIVWFVFPGEWRDVGRFHLTDGTFTGWYTNLCTPTSIEGADWRCTDLFLDHWLPAQGEGGWLDEDEFRRAVRDGLIDRQAERGALAERAAIEAALERGAWPPAIAREVDLARARAALKA